MERETLYKILLNNFFLKTEAKRIAYAKVNATDSRLQDPDTIWQSGLVQKAIRSRVNFVNNLKSAGWTSRQIAGTLSAWYRGNANDSSTWSFLKREYIIPSKKVSSYTLAVRARARAKVSRLSKATGLPYGKRLERPSRSTLNIRPQDKFPSF